jgi:hypothetical protein
MSIKSFSFQNVGQAGQTPTILYLDTNDTLATVTASGYLNGLVRENVPISTSMIACVKTKTNPNASTSSVGLFDIQNTSGVWSIIPNDGQLTLLNGELYIGNASNIATGVTMTGPVTISNTGVTTIGANSITSSNLATNLPQVARVNMTLAQFQGMYAAPVLLVPAAGANTALMFQGMQVVQNYGSAALAGGGVTAVQLGSTVDGAGVIASTTLSAATFQVTASSIYTFNPGVVVEPTATCANVGLYLSNVTGAFTGGTGSTFIANVYYSVIPLV